MTIQPNRLKQALKEERPRLAGYWLTTTSPTVTEISASAGFDWLLIDMEHSANDLSEIVDHLRAANGGTAEPMVRMPWNEPVLVKRLLDCGVRSLLFPYVETAEEAAHAVSATRYPPKGVRGISAINRATDYGRLKTYKDTYEADLCVIVQIETPEAVGRAAEIAAVEGVDGVFIGPGDLSANMGLIGQGWNAPAVRTLAMEGLAAIKKAGKAAGTLNYNEAQAKELFDAGFDLIAVGADSYTLARGSDQLAAAFKIP